MCHVFTKLSSLQGETLCSQFSWCKFYLVSEISRRSLKINSLRLPNFPQTSRIMSSFMSHTSFVAPQWNSYLQLSKFSHFLHMQFQANNTNDFMPSSPLQLKTWNRIHGRCVHLGFLGHFFFASCGKCHHSLRIFLSLWNCLWSILHCCLQNLCIYGVFTSIHFAVFIMLIDLSCNECSAAHNTDLSVWCFYICGGKTDPVGRSVRKVFNQMKSRTEGDPHGFLWMAAGALFCSSQPTCERTWGTSDRQRLLP